MALRPSPWFAALLLAAAACGTKGEEGAQRSHVER